MLAPFEGSHSEPCETAMKLSWRERKIDMPREPETKAPIAPDGIRERDGETTNYSGS